MPDQRYLSDADAFTIQMESDPLLRSTIMAAAVFDDVPDWEQLKHRFERATRLAPTFRQRLAPGRGPLAPPRWVDDPHFDLSWHLRRVAVPSPRTLDTVLEMAQVMGISAFDPIRPRWEATLVEGLEGGGSVLLLKIHHALTDGIGGIQLAAHIVDLQRRPKKQPPMPDLPEIRHESALTAPTDWLRFDLDRLGGMALGAMRAVPSMMNAMIRRPLGVWTDLGETVLSTLRIVEPATTTLSPVMTQRKLSWRFQALDVPLDSLKEAGRCASGSLNDAFLAGIAGGLTRYHAHHDEAVDHLRVTMPISLRTEHDSVGGNHITLVRVPVPVGKLDPVSRMLAIDETTRNWRHEKALPHSALIAGALNLLPNAVTGGMLKHVDLVASNVPGFDFDVFMAGAQLEGFYVFGPPIGAAANITLMSYRNTCCIGLNTDVAAVPDHDVFAGCIQAGFDEVLGLCAQPASANLRATVG